ncbi:MAG: type II toxin-antitoxin system VapC family toxin [Bacteroidia bacterium]|nr:type II toxin-antitoxin system VapC family toxin [Bacteroidia bacterium]
MEERYLIDTNTIIDYTSGLYPKKGLDFMDYVINTEINISVINKIEALSFSPKNEVQKECFELVKDFVDEANIISLSESIVNKTIELRKSFKTKLPDAIIAASALINDFTLITRNTDDFKNIAKLNIINPYDIE